jgi:hypothetical protein
VATIKELADECKQHYLAGDHKQASRCMREIHAMRPGKRFVQAEDGEVNRLGNRRGDGSRPLEDVD